MAYTITLTNGTILTTIADGTANNGSSSLFLPGKNYDGYGESMDNNLVHMLENFASVASPSNPLIGQLWYESTGNTRIYTGATNGYKTLATLQAVSTAPAGSVTGSLWWDTSSSQFKLYNGSTWTLVGPAFSSTQGKSGIEVESITDNTATVRTAVSLYSGNVRVAIVSNVAAYTPSVAIAGFPTIYPGITLSANVAGNISGAKFWGNAQNADTLNGLTSSAFARLSGATFTGAAAFQNGIFVGSGNILSVTASGTTATVYNTSGNLVIAANVSGTLTNAAVIAGTAEIYINNTYPQIDSVNNLGSSVSKFNQAFVNTVNSTNVIVSANVTAGNVDVSNLNVNGTATLTQALSASSGGTGTASLTANAVLLGNATSAVRTVSPGTSGNVLTSNGTTWVSQAAFIAGMIILWSGSAASIPSGWALCDGTSGTPDLRNRFIVGAGDTYAVGTTGGSANATLVSHTHTASVTDPGHVHSILGTSGSNFGQPLGGSPQIVSPTTTSSATTGISVGISTVGSSATNANLPPYYALCYIMKL